ncbi:hypothetical protein CTRU02_210792 [Colletotrichum truncatum]|uniref:Uncharacterized protein n=1 Tax=Colletotrichum truncatum TaxID=5467 RepID=A0ACC3YQ12_COLTU
MGERTGSRVFQWVWSYVTTRGSKNANQSSRCSCKGWRQDSKSYLFLAAQEEHPSWLRNAYQVTRESYSRNPIAMRSTEPIVT